MTILPIISTKAVASPPRSPLAHLRHRRDGAHRPLARGHVLEGEPARAVGVRLAARAEAHRVRAPGDAAAGERIPLRGDDAPFDPSADAQRRGRRPRAARPGRARTPGPRCPPTPRRGRGAAAPGRELVEHEAPSSSVSARGPLVPIHGLPPPLPSSATTRASWTGAPPEPTTRPETRAARSRTISSSAPASGRVSSGGSSCTWPSASTVSFHAPGPTRAKVKRPSSASKDCCSEGPPGALLSASMRKAVTGAPTSSTTRPEKASGPARVSTRFWACPRRRPRAARATAQQRPPARRPRPRPRSTRAP